MKKDNYRDRKEDKDKDAGSPRKDREKSRYHDKARKAYSKNNGYGPRNGKEDDTNDGNPGRRDDRGKSYERNRREYNRERDYGKSRKSEGRPGSGYDRYKKEENKSFSKFSGNRKGEDNRKKSFGRDYRQEKDKERGYSKRQDNGTRRGYDQKVFKDPYDAEGKMRLNKYIAHSGICSRREADEFITAGLITVNDKPVTELGSRVKRGDTVKYDGRILKAERKVYILFNKPRNIVTTSDDPEGRKTVLDLVRPTGGERIYPVGRLDRNTTGVLLLTNDGELAVRLSHPKYQHRKVYHVFLNKPLKETDYEKAASGIELEDGFIKPDSINYVKPDVKTEIGIEIHSGKNRIVRRIFENLGYEVEKLDRVVFAGLTKKNLPRGKWRFLSEREINILKMNAFE